MEKYQHTQIELLKIRGQKIAEVTLTDATPADDYSFRLTPMDKFAIYLKNKIDTDTINIFKDFLSIAS